MGPAAPEYAGIDVGTLLGGVVVVETVFGIGGIGRIRSRRSTRATCR